MLPITTPFGRGRNFAAQMTHQLAAREAVARAVEQGSNAPAAVNKWQVFRTLTEIRARLGVSDRSLSVLNALLSFHPETALSLPVSRRMESEEAEAEEPAFCDLIVFPSNRQLAQRAHGMAAATLWRHLSALVEAGLVLRRDSPNGKRYARKNTSVDSSHQGSRFSDAFGFDLTPLVTRAAEFEAVAEELRAIGRRRALLKERISLLRRDVTRTIGHGLDEGLAGDWEGWRQRAMALMTPLRRIRDDQALEQLAAELAQLRLEVANALETFINSYKMESSDPHSEAHQSNSKSQSLPDFEPASEKEGARSADRSVDDVAAGPTEPVEAAKPEPAAETKSLPLGLVMEACPDLHDYAPGGRVRSWPEFVAAAGAVRPMIGISPDAWREAQAMLGSIDAHIVVASILQRSVHSSEARAVPGSAPGSTAVVVNGSPAIQSAGGYLRALTEKARVGEFALGPVLMALIGQRLKAKRAAAGEVAG